MTPCIPPDRMAAIAASVAAPAIVHDREQPAPVVALPVGDHSRFVRMRMAAMDNTHQPIVADSIIAAARAKAQENGGTCYPFFAAELQALVLDLAAELNRLRGHGVLIPGPASQFLRAHLGDSEAMIEYIADDEGDLCVERALINGRWVDADNFAEAVIEQWHEAIRADIEQQRLDDAHTHAVRRHEAARGL